ncbi:MlaE family lipid ABC transporter permease subunit [candidate division KSB1 bacterium]|nr:MlaE family lipid ABC transporter permease subunit [candidate division KSB1 bacterium]
MIIVQLIHNTLSIEGPLVIAEVPRALEEIERRLQAFKGKELDVDLSGVERIDSAGVSLLDEVTVRAAHRSITLRIRHVPKHAREALKIFSSRGRMEPTGPKRDTFFVRLGEGVVNMGRASLDFLYLIADTAYFSIVGLVNKRGLRKGEFVNQSVLIGMNALPIVALISFLIGFILALQSAAQLRQFGAAIYVADLIGIAMTREMGPIMTAIVVSGRSGSAIASEIATMVVTEENDALKSMALHPVRYVLVPKIYAITVTMPLLTTLSVIIGILGAMVISITYLGIGPKPFFEELRTVLYLRDVLTGLAKSFIFAWIIALVGAYYGFRVRGGSEGVGRVTTASVVASIFWVILADSLMGLIFYFGQGVEY